MYKLDSTSSFDIILVVCLSFFIGITGGALGIAGPVLITPVLIVLGVPTLTAIGTSLTVGLLITFSTSLNYYVGGEVASILVLPLAAGFIIGTATGWYSAHRIDPKLINIALAGMLLALCIFLIYQLF